ncbi:hypothetical protein EYS14_01300 [Alteromonadaceae bacterium M269]|nr:hypothetical protein EYS14_01300 [Alteromonadaceae bacterium M269]
MRLLLALVYIGFGIWFYFRLGGSKLPPYIGIVFGMVLMFSSVVVCNEGFLRRIRGISDKEHINNLITNGMAIIESYKASEAITFEDLNTGCLCHVLKIGDNRAMCLYGQYLYDYAEILDDPDMEQQRKFPTDKFKLVRRTKSDEILRLDIGQNVIEEYKIESLRLENLYSLGFRLKNGEIVDGISFDKIRDACA